MESDQQNLPEKPSGPGRQKQRGSEEGEKKHTTVGIRWSSPTQLLIHRFGAYVWQSGRDAQFSPIYGRMCYESVYFFLYTARVNSASNR
jgi:hypothetical protein